MVWLGRGLVFFLGYVYYFALFELGVWYVCGVAGLPVDVDVQSPAEIMRNSIDHGVEDDGCENAVPADEWEIWLTLPAQSDTALAIFAADVFAQGWVLDENAEREEAQLGVVRHAWGPVRVLQEIGG